MEYLNHFNKMFLFLFLLYNFFLNMLCIKFLIPTLRWIRHDETIIGVFLYTGDACRWRVILGQHNRIEKHMAGIRDTRPNKHLSRSARNIFSDEKPPTPPSVDTGKLSVLPFSGYQIRRNKSKQNSFTLIISMTFKNLQIRDISFNFTRVKVGNMGRAIIH